MLTRDKFGRKKCTQRRSLFISRKIANTFDFSLENILAKFHQNPQISEGERNLLKYGEIQTSQI